MNSILLALALAAQDRPNVLLIYTDDQGSVDAGCYGAKDLETPHLDALAARGVRFTQMYAPSAVCSPSRAGLLTGRWPARAGVPGNVSSTRGDPGLPPSEVTIAEMFQAAGYATAHVGKWHLGYTPDTMPNGQGFDSSFGHMGGCIDNYSHFFYWAGPNRHDLWRDGKEVWEDGKFFLDLMEAECGRVLELHRERPFFMYWAINTPHYPLQGTGRWRERYRDLPSPRDKYAAFVSTTDEAIGRVLKKLDDLGLREKTIVVFQSDHGHSVEQRTFGGGGSAGPYRGAKFSLFEGGIRVPSIVSWPGTLPEGGVRKQAAFGCDWLPTLAELAGVEPPDRKLDGRSLAAVIRSADAPSPHESLYWRIGRAGRFQWAVREGPWKLIGNPKDPTGKLGEGDNPWLSNLERDAGERTNFASDYPEIVKRLGARQREFEKEIREESEKRD